MVHRFRVQGNQSHLHRQAQGEVLAAVFVRPYICRVARGAAALLAVARVAAHEPRPGAIGGNPPQLQNPRLPLLPAASKRIF